MEKYEEFMGIFEEEKVGVFSEEKERHKRLKKYKPERKINEQELEELSDQFEEILECQKKGILVPEKVLEIMAGGNRSKEDGSDTGGEKPLIDEKNDGGSSEEEVEFI